MYGLAFTGWYLLREEKMSINSTLAWHVAVHLRHKITKSQYLHYRI